MQRGRPFKRGQSGNPKGRPRGARNRATVAAEALLEGEAEALTRKAVELALAGDVTALRLCMERLVPPRKDRPVCLDLPPINGPEDAQRAVNVVLGAVAAGRLTPSEAAALCGLVDAARPEPRTVPLPCVMPTFQLNFVPASAPAAPQGTTPRPA